MKTESKLAALAVGLTVFLLGASVGLADVGDIGIYTSPAEQAGITTADFTHSWTNTVRDGGAIGLSAGNIELGVGHYMVMYNSRFDSSSGTNRSEIQSQLMLDGVDLATGWSQGYIRRSDGQNATITAGGGIIDVADNGDVLSLISYRTDDNGAGVKRAANATGIQLLKLDDNWDYARLSLAADQAGPTTGAWVDVAYDTQNELDTGSFAHNEATNPNEITLKAAGHYLVIANTYGFQSDDRTILKHRLTLDGTLIDGSQTTAYIRATRTVAPKAPHRSA